MRGGGRGKGMEGVKLGKRKVFRSPLPCPDVTPYHKEQWSFRFPLALRDSILQEAFDYYKDREKLYLDGTCELHHLYGTTHPEQSDKSWEQKECQ